MSETVERRHASDGTVSRALYSPCDRYRYGLERRWADTGNWILFVMLNPSTATEERNDPTIERCERRARALGFGGLRIGNLFAWRATRPQDLKAATAPVGPDNDALLLSWHREAQTTVAAWGIHGAHLGRDRAVLALLDGRLHHLGLTSAGHPRHPLYVPYKTQLQAWSPDAHGTPD